MRRLALVPIVLIALASGVVWLAGLHFPKVRWRSSGFVVGGIVLCGAVALLAVGVFGVLKAEPDSDDSLPIGDLGALITPSGPEEAIPAATPTPAGALTWHAEAIPAATFTRIGTLPRHAEAVPAATFTRIGTLPRHDETIPAGAAAPLPDVAGPTRMVIEKMGVDAPIITLGLDANRVPQVSNNPYVVVWYAFSAKPGQGSNAVFAGHVDWTVNGQPVTAVFWGLRELGEGDVVKILLEDGSELRYRVTHNLAIADNDPDTLELMYSTPNDVITLITCGGTWVPNRSMSLGGNYTHRIVVRAERVA